MLRPNKATLKFASSFKQMAPVMTYGRNFLMVGLLFMKQFSKGATMWFDGLCCKVLCVPMAAPRKLKVGAFIRDRSRI